MLNEAEMDNILVHQKDRILQLINLAKKKENVSILLIAKTCLQVVQELWEKCNYGYKWKELSDRIEDAYLNSFSL